MKPFRTTLVIMLMAAIAVPPAYGQDPPVPPPRPGQPPQLLQPPQEIPPLPPDQALAPLPLLPPLPPLPQLDFDFPLPAPRFEYQRLHDQLELLAMQAQGQTPEALRQLREQAERAREQSERAREEAERARELINRSTEYYRQGKSELDRREYERAIGYFDRVIERKTANVDGAMYWKAYALNRLGKRDQALTVLTELEKQHPKSAWLNDAKALAIEVKQAAGQGVSPESQTDEDLKLLAITSLNNQDPEAAVGLLEKVLNNPKSTPKVKERALYVLAQNRSTKGRGIIAQYAKGASNPDLQLTAISYLGQFRLPEGAQIMAEVYGSTSDPAVKRAILRSYQNSQSKDRLLQVAKTEQNSDLRLQAIQYLGNIQAGTELAELYNSESQYENKEAILRSLSNGQYLEKLMDIAKNEKDNRLRRSAIRLLGNHRRDRSADFVATLYNTEPEKLLKLEVINVLGNMQAAKQLVDIARKENDAAMKQEIVRRLSNIRSKEAVDYLMELLNK